MPKTKNPDSRSWVDKVAAWRPMKALNWGLLGYVSHRYAEPALSAAQDVVHNNVNVPIRKFLGLSPGSRVKTEADYTEAFLSALDDINISVLDKKMPDWRERASRGEPVQVLVRGYDYVPKYGGASSRSLGYRLTNPVGQIETTLGYYTVEVKDGKMITRDVTDWSAEEDMDQSTMYGKTRVLMGQLGTSPDAPDDEKIHINIQRSLPKSK